MGKVHTRLQTKTAQNPTLWGGTNLYGLYKGVTPAACTSKVNAGDWTSDVLGKTTEKNQLPQF